MLGYVLGGTLIIAFFLANHDLRYSLHPFEGIAPEAFAPGMENGTIERQASFIVMGLLSAILLFRVRGQSRRSTRGAVLRRLLIGFAVWSVLSIMWAEAPWLVFRRVAALLLIGVTAAAFAKYLSGKQVTWFVAIASATYLVIGVGAEVTLGTFHPFNAGYRFAGTVHPNVQGTNCALLLLSSLALLRGGERRKLVLAGLSVLGLSFLVVTGSRTALAAALTVIILFASIALFRRRVLVALPSILAVVLLILVAGPAASVWSDVVLLGRQEGTTTFTARADLWRDLSEYVRSKPLLGYGYGGFWTPAHIFEVSDRDAWSISSSHSEYLEILLDIGLVGLAIYVAILGVTLHSAASVISRTDGEYGWFYLGLLLFYIFDSFLEAHLFNLGLLIFVTLVAAIQLNSVRLVATRSGFSV